MGNGGNIMDVGVIGVGNMGGAYMGALSEHNLFFLELNDEKAKDIEDKYGAKRASSMEELIGGVKFVIIAVKPDAVEKVLTEMKKYNLEEKVVITLALGINIKFYEKMLEEGVKLVRVMPNTPTLIKKGICGYSFNENLDEVDKEQVKEILKSTGEAVEVSEDKLDIVTALSGSGPAYVFLLINALAEGGVKLGMPKQDSLKFVLETFIGAASMIKETGLHPEQLKDMVTSPGGSTAAGLFKMEENGVRKAMIETVVETYKKAKEFNKEGE
jgi:pyrroline-5-carboxylate reductase